VTPAPQDWICPACCAADGTPYRYPPGPLVYCQGCGRAMHAAEQIAAALACLTVSGNPAAELRRLRDAIEHKPPRQRVRQAAEGAELLSLRQVDALLGRRRGATAGLIGSGELAAARVGSRLRVARAELDRYLAASGVSLSARPRSRPASATGAEHAAAIRALRVLRRSGSS
jgi:excisionase family DNA binding protein